MSHYSWNAFREAYIMTVLSRVFCYVNFVVVFTARC